MSSLVAEWRSLARAVQEVLFLRTMPSLELAGMETASAPILLMGKKDRKTRAGKVR